MTSKIYHPERKHPEPYQHDLGPDASKGLNYGLEGAALPTRTAYDAKAVHNCLHQFTDDELKQMQVLQAGTRLETDATYFRLLEEGAPFLMPTATKTWELRTCISRKRICPTNSGTDWSVKTERELEQESLTI